jgi:hypothetical protein
MSYSFNAPAAPARQPLSPVRFVIQFVISLVKYLTTLIAGYSSVRG